MNHRYMHRQLSVYRTNKRYILCFVESDCVCDIHCLEKMCLAAFYVCKVDFDQFTAERHLLGCYNGNLLGTFCIDPFLLLSSDVS